MTDGDPLETHAERSWRLEAEGTQKTLDEATELLVDVEVWAHGSTTFPGELLSKLRLFLGPQKCSACDRCPCAVHAEEVES